MGIHTMTSEQLESLIAAHGSDPARWPDDARAAATQLLADSSAAQALLADYQQLDLQLTHLVVPPMPAMERRIALALRDATRKSLFDHVIEWLLPSSGGVLQWAWRPALVACLPLVCGIYLADFYSFGIDAPENSWQEELYLISMNDYAEISE